MSNLKPCPFCGGSPRVYFCDARGDYMTRDQGVVYIGGRVIDHKKIVCEKCGVRTKQYKTNKGAYNAWQRRV